MSSLRINKKYVGERERLKIKIYTPKKVKSSKEKREYVGGIITKFYILLKKYKKYIYDIYII